MFYLNNRLIIKYRIVCFVSGYSIGDSVIILIGAG
jgi:hypothetical protein